MVTIRKKTINRKHYFYLEHSFKVGRKVKKKELYLGKQIPNNIEKIKVDFTGSHRKQIWKLFENPC